MGTVCSAQRAIGTHLYSFSFYTCAYLGAAHTRVGKTCTLYNNLQVFDLLCSLPQLEAVVKRLASRTTTKQYLSRRPIPWDGLLQLSRPVVPNLQGVVRPPAKWAGKRPKKAVFSFSFLLPVGSPTTLFQIGGGTDGTEETV